MSAIVKRAPPGPLRAAVRVGREQFELPADRDKECHEGSYCQHVAAGLNPHFICHPQIAPVTLPSRHQSKQPAHRQHPVPT